MQAILDFFAGFGRAIVDGFEFILHIFRDILTMVKLLAKIPSIILNIFSFYPAEILMLLGLLVSVVILYKILGREG